MRRRAFAALLLLLAAGLVALGVGRVEWLAGKRARIAQVAARLAAPPQPVPPPARWRAIGSDAAYTRLIARGEWVHVAPVYVQAVTVLGPGFWQIAPLRTSRGVVLVNRGFVPMRGMAAPTGGATVTGLLRVSEPGGAFLRSNDPTGDRWYSRDVAAIARARGLGRVAPFFIDADARGPRWPRGGLTVVRFPDNHLVYAATWFALAGLALWGAWRVRQA